MSRFLKQVRGRARAYPRLLSLWRGARKSFRTRKVRPLTWAFRRAVIRILIEEPVIFDDRSRVEIARSATVSNALLNTVSGRISVGPHAFFGHNVCLITGTHDYRQIGPRLQYAVPDEGYDIIVHEGAWLASNVTVIGPCVIGAHAVVAAGSLVRDDVPAYGIVAGVPARQVGDVLARDRTQG